MNLVEPETVRQPAAASTIGSELCIAGWQPVDLTITGRRMSMTSQRTVRIALVGLGNVGRASSI